MDDNSSSLTAQLDDPPVATVPSAPALGRGRGRGRGRGGGGTAIAGIAELDATLGRGASPAPPAGGGKPLAPKKEVKDFRGPEGLFKKGDWTCNACGNVNWERRQSCNKCQNPKPNVITTDEAREGHGGGFHERQDRASVGTVEVDEDGYDDFGRKKIKARADKKAKEMAALARLQRSFGGGNLLGATSLAPIAKSPVPGQFDDAQPAPTVTLYDGSGRPKPAVSSSKSYNGNPRDGKDGDGEKGRDRGGRASHKTDDDRERDRDRDRDRDRRDRDRDRGRDRRRERSRSRSRDRSRERSRDRGKDRSRRRRSRSRSWSRDRRR